MRHVFPIGVVYETIECCGSFCEGPDDFQSWAAFAGGVRIVLQNRALDVRLYAIPALFRGFRSIHRGPLCHEREFHVQRKFVCERRCNLLSRLKLRVREARRQRLQ